MTTLTRDNREITDVSPIDFQSREIVFHEMKITGSFAGDIEDMVQGNDDLVNFLYEKVLFDGDRLIFDMGGNYFVVEYQDEFTRDKDIQMWKEKFENNGIFAKELEEGRQIPEFDGHFENDGKFYAIINGLNKLTPEIDPKQGIYKGVVVSPESYFELRTNKQEISEKVEGLIG